MSKNNQTVYIIDDEFEACKTAQYLFESVHYQVETYNNAHQFLDKYQPHAQSCLITDVRLPEMSGLELLEHLQQQRSNLPVIILTGYADIQMAVRAMKAGAKDFLLKPFNNQFLLELVQKCINDASHERSYEELRQRINSFSDREHQVTHLILDGKLNKEIAYELSLSISTIEAHRSSIMHKMQAKNLAQFVKMYLQVNSIH